MGGQRKNLRPELAAEIVPDNERIVMSQKLIFAIIALAVVLAAFLAYTQYSLLVPQ